MTQPYDPGSASTPTQEDLTARAAESADRCALLQRQLDAERAQAASLAAAHMAGLAAKEDADRLRLQLQAEREGAAALRAAAVEARRKLDGERAERAELERGFERAVEEEKGRLGKERARFERGVAARDAERAAAEAERGKLARAIAVRLFPSFPFHSSPFPLVPLLLSIACSMSPR